MQLDFIESFLIITFERLAVFFMLMDLSDYFVLMFFYQIKVRLVFLLLSILISRFYNSSIFKFVFFFTTSRGGKL